MAISFTLLRTFHAVAEERSFTLAARALGIGQPTVTTQIQELQNGYSVELFRRVGRKIELTEAGAALHHVTRRLAGIRKEAQEVLLAHGRLQVGSLRLAAVGPFHATEMIAAFRKAYPGITVSVTLGNSEQTLRHVVELEADVAVLAHTTSDARVHTAPYRTHPVIAFVGRNHPWFRRRRVHLRDFAGQRFVLREPGSTTRRAFEAALEKAGIAIDPILEIGSREGVWKAVEQGLGISVVADFEFVAHPNLHPVAIEGASIRTEYRLACLEERAASPKIRAFFDVVEKMRSSTPTK